MQTSNYRTLKRTSNRSFLFFPKYVTVHFSEKSVTIFIMFLKHYKKITLSLRWTFVLLRHLQIYELRKRTQHHFCWRQTLLLCYLTWCICKAIIFKLVLLMHSNRKLFVIDHSTNSDHIVKIQNNLSDKMAPITTVN